MLALIIRKELLENLMNIRFLAAIVISVVLIITSLIVLTRSYEDAVGDYRSRVAAQEEFIDHFGHFNRVAWMSRQARPPSPFQVFVLGINRDAQQENFVSNPIPVLLSRLDFVSIVTIIMTLMAILFSYNAICGEREAGLMRQMLSTGLSRNTIILGKFIGGNLRVE